MKIHKQRLFFAINFSREITAKFVKVRHMLQPCRGERPIPGSNLHITLSFLGNIDVSRQAKLYQIATALPAIPLTLSFDCLGYWSRPRILWAGCNTENQILAEWVELLKTNLANAEFPIDSRPFVPHVTLLRNARRRRQLPEITPISWQVENFSLMESSATPNGVNYRALHSWIIKPDEIG